MNNILIKWEIIYWCLRSPTLGSFSPEIMPCYWQWTSCWMKQCRSQIRTGYLLLVCKQTQLPWDSYDSLLANKSPVSEVKRVKDVHFRSLTSEQYILMPVDQRSYQQAQHHYGPQPATLRSPHRELLLVFLYRRRFLVFLVILLLLLLLLLSLAD